MVQHFGSETSLFEILDLTPPAQYQIVGGGENDYRPPSHNEIDAGFARRKACQPLENLCQGTEHTSGLPVCVSVAPDAHGTCLALSLAMRASEVLKDPVQLEIYMNEFYPLVKGWNWWSKCELNGLAS